MVEFSETLAIISANYRPNRWGATRCHPEDIKLASLDNLLDATAKYIIDMPTKESKKKMKYFEPEQVRRSYPVKAR